MLVSFLNSLLDGKEKITDLTYQNSENLGSTEFDRKAVFDVYCENENLFGNAKFTKTGDELENMFEKWLFAIHHLPDLIERNFKACKGVKDGLDSWRISGHASADFNTILSKLQSFDLQQLPIWIRKLKTITIKETLIHHQSNDETIVVISNVKYCIK